MARVPKEVAEYLRKLGQTHGRMGGQTAAKNMTAEERSARSKKASDAAAKKRTAERLARELAAKARKKRARTTKGPQKTPEAARNLLIERGCDPKLLGDLIGFVTSARRRDNPQSPIHREQVFRDSDPGHLGHLEEEIFALSRKLSILFTEPGAQFVYLGNFLPWTLFLPILLSMYGYQLKNFRVLLNSRRPVMLDHLKCRLVKYVWDATGGKRWHDAELALLCNEERRAWTKWRNEHYQDPTPPI